jgi:hypothetical protein
MFFFIRTRGIMTGSVMVYKEFYQGQTPEHPFSLVNQQLAGTYTWIEALDRLVVLSPGVLLQYQKVQAQQLWLDVNTSGKAGAQIPQPPLGDYSSPWGR